MGIIILAAVMMAKSTAMFHVEVKRYDTHRSACQDVIGQLVITVAEAKFVEKISNTTFALGLGFLVLSRILAFGSLDLGSLSGS